MDIHIICDYFGMGEFTNPTYEVVGQKYGISSRQRVRQIINDYFLMNILDDDLIALKEVAAIIGQEPGWLVNDFINRISLFIGE